MNGDGFDLLKVLRLARFIFELMTRHPDEVKIESKTEGDRQVLSMSLPRARFLDGVKKGVWDEPTQGK
jgi:hypothetical protein